MTRPRSDRAFLWALLGIVAAGLALRLAYVVASRQYHDFQGDAFFYHAGANVLADGRGFVSPFFAHRSVQAAEHPPLYVVFLAIPSVLGFQSVLAHLVWSSLLGGVTIFLVGLIGRDVFSSRAGLGAAALAAFYPNVWVPDTSLMAETLAMASTALALWLAYRYWRAPSVGRLALVGLAGGLGALSRSELVLLIPFLVVPLAVLAPGPDRRRRGKAIGAGLAAGIVVIAPWIGFNLARFEQPVFLTSSYGSLLSAANCDDVWRGPLKSYFLQSCTIHIRDTEMPPGNLDQSQQDEVYRKAALRYVRHHLDLLPGVVAARVAGIVGLYHPARQINIDSAIEGRPTWLARSGMYAFWALAVLSAAGAVILRRSRRAPVFPLLVPPVIVLVTAVVTYASTRFRSSSEVVVCVLAAITIDSAITALRRPTAEADPTPAA
jgi:4-amino-4-deoxy-L-arabinose transferase-like glycosyltransferase